VRKPPSRKGSTSEVAKLREDLGVAVNNTELLQESIADLENQLREPGWIRMSAMAEIEFSRAGLKEISSACRLMSIKNPLIVRGLSLRAAYIWGQGVEISARATGRRDENDAEQDVNAVVQAFLDDEANTRTLWGEEARVRLDRSLSTDGNLFCTLFTKPTTGRVQARMLPFDQIDDIVTNPEDESEPWFYRRKWNQHTIDPATGVSSDVKVMERLYPDVSFRPLVRPRKYGQVDVAWDSPVVHLKVNDLLGWKWGIGDVYSAVDWARAYKDFLTDWARLMKSLSKYAWRLTATGSKGALAARNRIAQVPSFNSAGEPNTAGSTAAMTSDLKLESVSKSGATLDSESGRPIAAMAAAGLGLPVTMLLCDPGVTGARATAQTLDGPTEKVMQQRQAIWAGFLRRILGYVIQESARAPQGALKAKFGRDADGRETMLLAGDTDKTINVIWPDLDDIDPAIIVKAIVEASSTGTIPPELVLQLLLGALGVRDIDEILEGLLDKDGNFLWPNAPPLGGQQAADAERAGRDPAATGDGPMTPDDPDAEGDAGGDQPQDPEAPTGTAGNGRAGS
jgi:hypothetical protein